MGTGWIIALDFDWPVVNDTIYFWLNIDFWPIDPNYMVGAFFDRKTKIVKKIPHKPNQTVYLRKSDSKNKITVRCRDEVGNVLPLSPVPRAWAQFLRKKNLDLNYLNDLGCGRFWSCPQDTLYNLQELDFPDIDNTWIIDLAYQIYNNGNLYVFPFTVEGPLTSSLTLENDISKFKRVDYLFGPRGAPQGSVLTQSIDAGRDIGGYVRTEVELDMEAHTPNTLTAYYLPVPPNHSWGIYSLKATYAQFNPAVIKTHNMDIMASDTTQFSSGFSSAANPLSVKLGYGIPQWTGRTDNSSNVINIAPQKYAFYVHPLWWYGYGNLDNPTGEPTRYVLFSGSMTIDSGIMEAGSWAVTAGRYSLEFYSTQYQITDIMGKATARLEFDTRRADRNPPYMTNLQIVTGGNISDEYHRDTTRIEFEAGDDVGIDSAMVYFQPYGATNWIQGNLTNVGNAYTTPDIPDLPGGHVSMRLRFVDQARNSLDYRVEPAFQFYLSAPKAAPELMSPIDGENEQPAVVTLRWNESFTAKNYHIQFATDSAMTNPLADDASISHPLRRVYPPGKGVTYYWRVSAQNPAGSSPFSEVWRFTTTTDTWTNQRGETVKTSRGTLVCRRPRSPSSSITGPILPSRRRRASGFGAWRRSWATARTR